MAKLVLKEFRCVEDTTEVGSESPYFITFVGDLATLKTSIKLTRQGSWHNQVDIGELWPVNETVADGISLNPNQTVVLVALVEEDEGLDVSNFELVNVIKTITAAKLTSLKNAGVNQLTPTVKGWIRDSFRTAVYLALSSSSGANDDLLGTRNLWLTGQLGAQPLLHIYAGGGYYRVRYVAE
jgi:hypothetical protein